MAAPNIPALTDAGLVKAWAAMASVLSTVTVQDVPTITRDIAADTETATWGVSQSLSAFLYDDEDAPDDQGTDKEMAASLPILKKMAIVRVRDFTPPVTEITSRAEVVEGANVWKVFHVERPPAQSIFILHLRQ